ncbi:hypothetical protein PP940_gp226 [Rhizobium phage RL2RES]|uniref:Uncharacterized protein n=1 Tax=Rhizobium phage RL2RES TaxID=103371 RepID=A0A6B9JDF9_9CAUD|nr:hypothetical protein PP940_gp226 [Rhizobium phage RL2RES]QGZ14236.1 hypothetical protein RL2RES_226 [Rhizobium phage RL2RES]
MVKEECISYLALNNGVEATTNDFNYFLKRLNEDGPDITPDVFDLLAEKAEDIRIMKLVRDSIATTIEKRGEFTKNDRVEIAEFYRHELMRLSMPNVESNVAKRMRNSIARFLQIWTM